MNHGPLERRAAIALTLVVGFALFSVAAVLSAAATGNTTMLIALGLLWPLTGVCYGLALARAWRQLARSRRRTRERPWR